MNSKSKLVSRLVTFSFLLGFLYISLFYLAPLVSQFASKILNPNQVTNVPVIVAKPQLTNFKPLVNQNSINFEGVAQAKSKVVLYLNGNYLTETLTNESGKFIFSEIGIVKGKNTVKLYAQTLNGVKSEETELYEINFDDIKPEIKKINIKDNEDIRNLNQNINIIGEVSEPVEIEINGRRVFNIMGNNFDYLLGLKEGENKVEIKITDKAGNELKQTYKLNYQKD